MARVEILAWKESPEGFWPCMSQRLESKLSIAVQLNSHVTGGPVNVHRGAAMVVLKLNATARGAAIGKEPNAPAVFVDDLRTRCVETYLEGRIELEKLAS
jgi:hypothetical protein